MCVCTSVYVYLPTVQKKKKKKQCLLTTTNGDRQQKGKDQGIYVCTNVVCIFIACMMNKWCAFGPPSRPKMRRMSTMQLDGPSKPLRVDRQ